MRLAIILPALPPAQLPKSRPDPQINDLARSLQMSEEELRFFNLAAC